MKQVCPNATPREPSIASIRRPKQVVQTTNQKVPQAKALVDGLRAEGAAHRPSVLKPIDFIYFDLWHYDGRTAKHGAFMGGADFVQWHGNYPILRKTVELKEMART